MNTNAVVQRALSLARQYGAALAVLHVVDYFWPADAEYAEPVLPPIDEAEEKLLKAAHQRLDSFLEAAEIAEAERIVVAGRPGHEIIQVAERERAGPVPGNWMGSSWKVIGVHTRCRLPNSPPSQSISRYCKSG